MATRAYFMINVAEKFCPNGYRDVLKDLVTIPEVQSIERVDGICDLMVKVEPPLRVRSIADKILAKEWTKRLHVLTVEPAEPSETIKLTEPEFLKTQTSTPR